MGNTNKVIAASSGAGKSYLTKNGLIPKALENGCRIAILDVEGEYHSYSDATVQDPFRYKDAFKDGHRVVNFEPDYVNEQTEQAGKVCDQFIEGATEIQVVEEEKKPLVLIIEEAHNFQKSTKIYSSKLKRANKQGQKYKVSVWQISQEPQDYERSSWNNAGDVILMRMRQVPKKAVKLAPEVTESELQELGIGEFYHIPDDVNLPVKKFPPI